MQLAFLRALIKHSLTQRTRYSVVLRKQIGFKFIFESIYRGKSSIGCGR